MGEDALIHVVALLARSPAGSLKPPFLGRHAEQAGRPLMGQLGFGTMAAGRMAAAAAGAGKMMVETGCTAARRPQRVGVYVPSKTKVVQTLVDPARFSKRAG